MNSNNLGYLEADLTGSLTLLLTTKNMSRSFSQYLNVRKSLKFTALLLRDEGRRGRSVTTASPSSNSIWILRATYSSEKLSHLYMKYFEPSCKSNLSLSRMN